MKDELNVMIPIAPNCINNNNTSSPCQLNPEVLTVVNPVTHTADVDVNKLSINDIPF